jgi:hypothetical protein
MLGMKRLLRRWWFWVVTIPVLAIVIYGGMIAAFMVGEPNLTRNVTKEWNVAAESIPPDQRADPIYRQAAAMTHDVPEALRKQWPNISPSDPEWNAAAEFLRGEEPALALVRRAASLPHAGFVLSDEMTDDYLHGEAKQQALLNPKPATKASENPIAIDVLLPHLGAMRAWARNLTGDARIALNAGDTARAQDDIRALLGMARHAGEPPILISSLVQIAIHALTSNLVLETILEHPGALNDAQLAEIDAALASVHPNDMFRDSIAHEHDFLEDFVQRVYTDDGHGDGALCYAGMKTMESIGAMMDGRGATKPDPTMSSIVIAVTGPVVSHLTAGRKDASESAKRAYDLAVAYEAQPAWQRTASLYDAEIGRMHGAGTLRYQITNLLMPAFSPAIASFTQETQMLDATRAAIAIERHRLAHGSYPVSLSELVPTYLPAVPVDQYDGKPLRYKLIDGKPLLYSVGCDGKDDGGVRPAPLTPGSTKSALAQRWLPPSQRGQCPSGDWVFWPIEWPNRDEGK